MAKVKLIMAIIISRALLVYITTSIESMLMLEDLEHAPQEILKISYLLRMNLRTILIKFVDPCDISITEINSMLTTIDIWICQCGLVVSLNLCATNGYILLL